MVVPWKVAHLFVRCAEYLCHCHPSEELCLLQLKRTKKLSSSSLVPRPRGRREKWPGIHCLRMHKRFRKSSTNESDYGQVTRGYYAEK